MTYYEPQSQKALFGNIVLWVLGIGALVLLIGAISFGISWITAGPSGALQARQQIKSGAFRIQAYNHFFDECASVQTLDEALNESYSELKTAKGDDVTRIRINIGAQLNDRNDAANQYNADTHKNYTVGQYKSSGLPYEIGPYQKGQVDSCGS